ncbi:MAG TPA: hypothetical protein ENF28_05465 [Proteobacteria bacterium]|nr:hypothetical protein [Pseudomonadota bacterium]
MFFITFAAAGGDFHPVHRDRGLELKVDRPFIFLIRDLETGTVLFVGRVENPTP